MNPTNFFAVAKQHIGHSVTVVGHGNMEGQEDYREVHFDCQCGVRLGTLKASAGQDDVARIHERIVSNSLAQMLEYAVLRIKQVEIDPTKDPVMVKWLEDAKELLEIANMMVPQEDSGEQHDEDKRPTP